MIEGTIKLTLEITKPSQVQELTKFLETYFPMVEAVTPPPVVTLADTILRAAESTVSPAAEEEPVKPITHHHKKRSELTDDEKKAKKSAYMRAWYLKHHPGTKRRVKKVTASEIPTTGFSQKLKEKHTGDDKQAVKEEAKIADERVLMGSSVCQNATCPYVPSDYRPQDMVTGKSGARYCCDECRAEVNDN